MLVGLIISWFVLVPWQTGLAGLASAANIETLVSTVFREKVRFIGAGTIGVAAIWTLVKLVGPVVSGLRSAMAASRVRKAGDGASLPITERDIPIGIVALVSVASLIPIAWLLAGFAIKGGLGSLLLPLVLGGVIFVVLMGFLVSAVCGYMAGLIGSSNSPLSGVGILAVIAALIFIL